MVERATAGSGLDVLGTVDAGLDRLIDPFRDRPLADAAAYLASALGDHGLLWLLIGVLRGRRPSRRFAAARAVVFTGIVSPGVNAGFKALVGRARPPRERSRALPVRIPETASFPSGHALAAWCAATLLAEEDELAPVYYLLAAAVSWSRVHVRLHHPSDVLAGMALGILLGRIGRLVVPLGGRVRPV